MIHNDNDKYNIVCKSTKTFCQNFSTCLIWKEKFFEKENLTSQNLDFKGMIQSNSNKSSKVYHWKILNRKKMYCTFTIFIYKNTSCISPSQYRESYL